MILPENIEKLNQLTKQEGKFVFFFTADWCPDCVFIKPKMPEIEAENPEFQFVQVDRDTFIDFIQDWDIMGIPSFVVTENGQEIGRLVNKNRKTKEEVNNFLADYK